MGGAREALIIASSVYEDPELQELRAPAADAEALAGALGNPDIGAFRVTSLMNEPAHVLSERIEDFFVDRSPEDVLLLHLSCHGVKDESGDLYFATKSTKRRRLAATAISADFVKRLMGRSLSRRMVLLLDCCYSGAFENGMLHRSETSIHLDHFATGRGRAVITASSAMEYAFEGSAAASALTVTQPSVFTSALVKGLTTGDADLDEDGLITIEELYHFVADEVRKATPHQTPHLSTVGMEDKLVIARRLGPVSHPAELSADLMNALTSDLPRVRLAVIPELARIVKGSHAGLRRSAQQALESLEHDDSQLVRTTAAAALAHPSTGAAAPATAPDRRPPPAPATIVPSSATAIAGPPKQGRVHSRTPGAAIAAVAMFSAASVALFALSFSSDWYRNRKGQSAAYLAGLNIGPTIAVVISVLLVVLRARLTFARVGAMLGAAAFLVTFSVDSFARRWSADSDRLTTPALALALALLLSSVFALRPLIDLGSQPSFLSRRQRLTAATLGWLAAAWWCADGLHNAGALTGRSWLVHVWYALPVALAATLLALPRRGDARAHRTGLAALCMMAVAGALANAEHPAQYHFSTDPDYQTSHLIADLILVAILGVTAIVTGVILLRDTNQARASAKRVAGPGSGG